MVKIRLARSGSKERKFFRIVALDEQKKRNGKSLDVLGFWQPGKNLLELDKDKLKNWVLKGAVVSKRVEKLANL